MPSAPPRTLSTRLLRLPPPSPTRPHAPTGWHGGQWPLRLQLKPWCFLAFLPNLSWQESFPLRFKGFHVVNQPFYFAALFAVVRPFLKEKMKRRVSRPGWSAGHSGGRTDRQTDRDLESN